MRMRDYVVLAQSHSPRWIIQKGIKRIRRGIKRYFSERRDFRRCTHSSPIPYKISRLYNYFDPPPFHYLNARGNEIAAVAELYLEHCFDLLGSGWVQVRHGMISRGIEECQYQAEAKIAVDSEGRWLEGRLNQSNLGESQRIWRLVDQDYNPIDWHLDYKSGYRWSGNTWYHSIPYGHKPGVDVKVPWELARMQHFPLLVWAYILAANGEKGFQASQVYVREFRNEILDFIATNPPRFGVNWRSTMDVAIRISNWLVAYDLFRACGVMFDESFETTFFHSIYEHGRHIANNLEWDERWRGNHYLSNVVGLLFVASYLTCAPETDAWLAFAIQELVNEVGCQFNREGSNFEASTSYHRLSAEMLVYATALVIGLSEEKRMALKEYDYHLFRYRPKLRLCPIPLYPLAGGERSTPFPISYIERVERMAEFTMHLTKPNGHTPQIGDNDSGRFLKLQPLFHLMKVDEAGNLTANLKRSSVHSDTEHYRDEDHLDHRHLVAAVNGLFGREDFTEFTGSRWIETELVRQLAKGILLPSYKGSDEPTTAEQNYTHECKESSCIGQSGASESTSKIFSKRNRSLDGNKLYAYPEFGIFIFKSKNIYLAIRCGPIGQNGNGGHAHNDNLSFELNFQGKDFIIDGGSYLYTPFPSIRNAFRSTRSHNTLALDGVEQNDWAEGLVGLFSMKDQAQAHVLKLGNRYFLGEHYGFGSIYRRELEVYDSSVVFEDILDTNKASQIILNLAPEVEILCLGKRGAQEFCLEMRNADLYVEALLKSFERVEIVDGYFSQGYGKRVRNCLVKCHRGKPRTKVEIAIRQGDSEDKCIVS
ncbi:MAG TPA: alginate lyase family protein [Thermodesulfobacteriota bacterium]|nr:alginate lyase family protein [Thermodesulfobacteriota bacterium]